MDDLSERVGSELVSGISLRAVLDANLLGASFAAETSAHGSVVVELLDADASAELGADFIEGARRAAAIDHPGAVPVLGHGVTRHGEAYVIVPSFVGERGRDLVQRRPARIPPVEALRLAGDLLDVLAAAHAAGLVHGGLTTSELFITEDGSIRLLGLGWSEVRRRLAERRDALPLAAGFAAPERIAEPRRAADEASDVWSVGAVLFSLLSGELPYEGRTEAEQRQNAIERPPRSLTELFGDTPIVLARVVDTALDPDPGRRFAPTRMRSVAREVAQLPELFLLRDLRTHQAPPPVSGPRRSPSAELEPARPPSSQPAPPESSSPGQLRALAPAVPSNSIAIDFRTAETMPAPAPPTARRAAADTVPAMPSVDTPPPSALRRRMADVLVGEATASESDIRRLVELFHKLEALLVARNDSQAASTALDELTQHASTALETSSGGFVWNVAPWGFLAGEHAVWEPVGVLAALPYRLYRDGVRSFGLLSGIEAHELRRFAEILAMDDAPDDDDDRVTLLHEAGFEHLVFRAIEPRGALGGERRRELARERQSIVALATFETTTQLEECWHESHKGAEPHCTELTVATPTDLSDDELGQLVARFDGEWCPTAPRVASAASSAMTIPYRRRAIERHLVSALESMAGEQPERALEIVQSLMHEPSELAARVSGATVSSLSCASSTLSPAALHVLNDLIDLLDSRHAEALADCLPRVGDPSIAARIEHRLTAGMSGHESALGALLARAERSLALGVARMLSSIDTLAAKEALARGAESADPLVRVEALGHAEGPSSERVRAELSKWLVEASEAERLLALEALELHRVRVAAPFLALRVRSREFDGLSIDERQRLFATLAVLAPARAEAVALEVLQESRLVSLPSHEETRELAADVLGELASSEEVLDALDTEARRFWRTSERVRSAAARARDEVAKKSVPPGRREGGAS